MKLSRRDFFRGSGAVAAGFWGLHRYLNAAEAYQSEIVAYGELQCDPHRILDLPKGFTYTIMAKTGDLMADGLTNPGAPDGMAAFTLDRDRVALLCNHELTNDNTFLGPYGLKNERAADIPCKKIYDSGKEGRMSLGGVSTFVWNRKRRQVESHFLSLAGTERNCAGGPTPWNTWISCEESVLKADSTHVCHHGYNFEVPVRSRPGLCDPVPLKAMGRFYHEAVAVDPATGIVYQTEDEDDGLITRFIPNEPKKLHCGGRLEALVVKDQTSCDTRNWPDKGAAKFAINQAVPVCWMPIEDTENLETPTMRAAASEAGSAIFARGEGMWYGAGKIWFACTSGGIAKSGQVFYYSPSPYEGTCDEANQPGTLTLYLEPNNTQLLQYGDNLTIAPWGDLILCEDGLNDQFLRGVTPEGKIYTLARNGYFGCSELCGVCFDPNDSTLFVNIQVPGITLAINGPWEKMKCS